MRFSLILFFNLLTIIGCKRERYSESESTKDYSNYTSEAFQYAKNNDLSTEFYILIDFSIHSGKKRLFVIDFNTRKPRQSFMVTHGMGNNSKEQNVKFSNVPNSHASSGGKYILGSKKVYSPGYRYKYIMYGKESTNSNAVNRNVVFHPWTVVPNDETYPNSIARSWGCPAVSTNSFNTIDKWIQQTNGRVLMWIIN